MLPKSSFSRSVQLTKNLEWNWLFSRLPDHFFATIGSDPAQNIKITLLDTRDRFGAAPGGRSGWGTHGYAGGSTFWAGWDIWEPEAQ